jgi:hypothetical protein
MTNNLFTPTSAVIAPFDYGALDPTLASDLQKQADHIRNRLRKQVADVIESGRDLIAAKAHLDHGVFLTWVENAIGLSPRMAQVFMRVAELAADNDNYEKFSLFGVSAVYRLAAKSTPPELREQILDRATAGEVLADRNIADLISREVSARKAAAAKVEEKDVRAKRRVECSEAQAQWERGPAEQKERERKLKASVEAVASKIADHLAPDVLAEVRRLLSKYQGHYKTGDFLIAGLLQIIVPPPAAPPDDDLTIPDCLDRSRPDWGHK